MGYYSTPEFIAKYLTEEMLRINPNGKYVLDPAVGKEGLLSYFYEAGKEIDSFDIIDYGHHKMSHFVNMNFIDYYKEIKSQEFLTVPSASKYDYIIAPPPIIVMK